MAAVGAAFEVLSTTRFCRAVNGRLLFKARLVPYLHGATGRWFMFVRVTLGRSAY
jgi:hypothetical protein